MKDLDRQALEQQLLISAGQHYLSAGPEGLPPTYLAQFARLHQ